MLLWVAVLFAPGCGPGSRRLRGSGAQVEYGVYKARLARAGEAELGFRVLLYAAEPDRLHAEILPPVGGPRLIVDGGSGRIAITVPPERTSWVGEAGEGSLSSVIGVEIGLTGLVGFLLHGESATGDAELTREPEEGNGLPRAFAISTEGYRLSFVLKKRRRLDSDPASLAMGTAPAGMELRPLEELGELQPGGLLGASVPRAAP